VHWAESSRQRLSVEDVPIEEPEIELIIKQRTRRNRSHLHNEYPIDQCSSP